MANSRKSTKKPATVAQFPAPKSAVGVEDVPEEFHEPTEGAAPAPPRNPLRKKEPRLPQTGDFFQRVAAIKQEEWDSQRIYLYLYVLEPLVNLKQSGGKSYLNRYSQPVRDEHQIAVEHGSGRYRMMLAYNKVSPDESTEIARHEFEIYNIQYPPRVPKAAWINDPRNAKWEALLPKEAPPGAAASTIVDAMKMVSDIRRDVREEIGDPEEQPRASEMLETMKAAKELFGPAATATQAKDPLEIAVALATTMMQMKADNPVIDMYRDELKALREEMKEERAANRAAAEKAAPATAPKTLLDQLTEIAALGEKLDPIKKLFGFNGASEAAGRAARTTALDVVRDLVTGPAGATLAQGIGVLISNLATASAPTGPAPIVLNAAQPNGTIPPVEHPEQRIQRIGETITKPMLAEYFMKGATGQEWAQTMFDLWPEDYVYMRGLGADSIINRYRRFPQAWNVIAMREADFVTFIQEFCAWDPNADEGPAPPNDGDAGVVDLTAEATA
jgi:hypothetical protein